MLQDKKVLAIIPARGGSKGIKDKNVAELNGKPLIWYSISEALKSEYIDDVLVSTDSENIRDVALEYGAQVPFLRPSEFAGDNSKTSEAIFFSVSELAKEGKEYDIIVLLQPTSPLRTVQDIDNALETYMSNGMKSLVSVSEVEDHPFFMRTIEENEMKKLVDQSISCRRQDLPKVYKVNGCIYINKTEEIDSNTVFNDNESPFIMEKDNSIDIDSYSDLYLAEYYLKNR